MNDETNEQERPSVWGPWRLDWLPDGASGEYEPQLAHSGTAPAHRGYEGFPLWDLDRPEKLLAELVLAIPVVSLEDLRALMTALQDLGFIDTCRHTRGGADVEGIRRCLRDRGWQPPNEGAW